MAAPINVSMFTHSILFEERLGGPVTRVGREMRSFFCKGAINGRVEEVAHLIRQFLQAHPNLLCMTNEQDLESTLQERPYLVMNNNVVSLSARELAPQTTPIECVDLFFSGSILSEPAICEMGHSFEKTHLEEWKGTVGNICPKNEYDHKITEAEGDPIVVDLLAKAKIESSLGQFQKRLRQDKARALLNEVCLQTLKDRSDPLFMVEGGAKIFFKGSEVALKVAPAIEVLSKVSSLFTEAIPGISLFSGVIFCVIRIVDGWKRGDKTQYLKAFIELVSGIAGCFPGIGTAVSIALDLIMVAHDAYVYFYKDRHPHIEFTESQCREIFGFEPAQEMTEKDINEAYLKFSDTYSDLVAAQFEFADQAIWRAALDQAKEHVKAVLMKAYTTQTNNDHTSNHSLNAMSS